MGSSKVFFVIGSLVASAFIVAFSGCAKNEVTPKVVSKIETTVEGQPPESAFRLSDEKAQAKLSAGEGPIALDITTPSASPMVVATVTLQKASLIGRTFLYGTDLQYSSINDGELSLTLQSMTVTHTLVTFRIVDDRLQMVADRRHLFESDINHPERLIHEFAIKSQDDASVTVEFRSASPLLSTVVKDDKAPAPRTSWVRSAQFVPEGEYMMFETSIELADGSIAEFMESFVPRDTVVPKDAKPLLSDAPEKDAFAERFRFLDNKDLFLDLPDKGRTKVKVADRFYRKAGQTIDWYVTPNVPEEFLVEIQTSVEGWNRYSQKMFGEDIVAFKGKLPQGIRIGDPRYNVINWDSVAQAGAAYESQASDPLTGVQSHSLIYLPKAWVNIGREYWEQGGASEALVANTARLKKAVERGSFLGSKLPVRCMHEVFEAASLEARSNPDGFSKELLKGVLFHEMGHAMGLAHNFKASLVLDYDDPATAFTTSIMDYNQYQLEKVAFDSLDKATGPLLEYDRQIMSVLYNEGKDIAESDPKLPACNDDETDSEDDGVDPLCIRYDAGRDPSTTLMRTIALLKDENARARDQRSLPVAIRSLNDELGDAALAKTKEDVAARVQKTIKDVTGISNYYYAMGAQSLSYLARANVRLLRQFKDGVVPAGYDEMAMRARAIEGVRYAATAEALEPGTRAAIDAHTQALTAWVSSSAYVQSVESGKQGDETKAFVAELAKLPATIEAGVLSRLRTRVFTDMKASAKAPFYMLEGANAQDFERETAVLLSRGSTDSLSSGATRAEGERLEAVKSLKTFANTAVGSQIVADTKTELLSEARKAKTLAARKAAVNVLNELNKPEEKKAD